MESEKDRWKKEAISVREKKQFETARMQEEIASLTKDMQ